MGDFPLMTDRGTFVINGTERVVVSPARPLARRVLRRGARQDDRQVDLHRQGHPRARRVARARDRQARHRVRAHRPQAQAAGHACSLKALGIAETREEILELFGDSECIKRTLEKDYTETREEALIEIYKRLRPGEPPTVESARSLLDGLFFNPQRYDLAKVGRYKVNRKLGLELPDRAVDADQRGHPRRGPLPRPPVGGRRRLRRRRHRPLRQPPRPLGRRAHPEPVPHRPRPHGARRARAHDHAGRRADHAAVRSSTSGRSWPPSRSSSGPASSRSSWTRRTRSPG